MSETITTYINGNILTSISSDGTRIRKWKSEPTPEYPASIDLKLTNFCDLSEFCQWCHESSNKSGTHANLKDYQFLLEQLPAGTELAIGGGNPLDHPNLNSFLEKAKRNGIICNMTINELHLKKFKKEITYLIKNKLIRGVGITYSGRHKKELEYFCNLTDNVVFHVIMGVHELSCLDDIQKYSNKVLILGYKEFRKGKSFYSKEVENKKYQWYIRLPLYFKKMVLSFDNLAIEQLKIRRWFTDKSWEHFYQGKEGQFTMFIDGVENNYAISSTSEERYKIKKDIKSIFNKIRKNDHGY